MSGALSLLTNVLDQSTPTPQTYFHQATWLGITLNVTQITHNFSRQSAKFKIPYRTDFGVIVEDQGIGENSFVVQAQIVGSQGLFVDAYEKANQLIENTNKYAGFGTFSHPAFGDLNVYCESSKIVQNESFGCVEVELSFVIVPQQTSQASITSNPSGNVIADTLNSYSAIISDYQNKLNSYLNAGQQYITGVIAALTPILTQINTIWNDGAGILNSTKSLNFVVPKNSYYVDSINNFGIRTQPPLLNSLSATLPIPAMIQQAEQLIIANIASSRVALLSTANDALIAADNNDISNVVTSVAASIQISTDVAPSPIDQIRILTLNMANYIPVNNSPGSAETGNFIRRYSLTQIAAACAAYTPPSSSEALNLLKSISPMFDNEIIIAGNANDYASFTALRKLKQSLIADFNYRSAQLPDTQTTTILQGLNGVPTCVACQLLYGNMDNFIDLIIRNNPIHPGFLNTANIEIINP